MLPLQAVRDALITLGCWLVMCPAAHGAEHVVLSNGFAVDCHHSVATPDGKVRLFLNADGSSYLDVDAARIQRSEAVTEAAPASVATTPPAVVPLPSHTIDTLLNEQGRVHGLNVDLLRSVVQAESGGHVRAVSRTGAQGLMQLMPTTAKSLGVADSFAPDQNLRGGTTYLDGLLVRYHDNLLLALAAYNAGPGAVDRYHGIPPFRETQAYVARIVRDFNRRSLLTQRAALAEIQPTR